MSTHSRSPLSSTTYSQQSALVSPLKKKAMSITQTYYLAHTARGKLSSEAARADHNLRLLVGHANLLDSLMLELADAEQEQESWFNQSVKGAQKEEKHIQWADAVVEEPEEDWQAEDADSDSSDDSDYDSDEDIEMESAGFVSLRRVPSNYIPAGEEDEEEIEDDGEEDYDELALTLSPSRSVQPPELDHDSDSSEDESMPPSPPAIILPTFSEKQRQQIATTSYYSSKSEQQAQIPASKQEAFLEEGFYLPQRQSPGLISAISVY